MSAIQQQVYDREIASLLSTWKTGFLVGFICTAIQLRHELFQLRRYADYASKFQFS